MGFVVIVFSGQTKIGVGFARVKDGLAGLIYFKLYPGTAGWVTRREFVASLIEQAQAKMHRIASYINGL